jgi:hypothetical protein
MSSPSGQSMFHCRRQLFTSHFDDLHGIAQGSDRLRPASVFVPSYDKHPQGIPGAFLSQRLISLGQYTCLKHKGT